MIGLLAALLLAQPLAAPAPLSPPFAPLPTITVSADDTAIDHSCRVVVAPGAVIGDPNGDGVLHITADDLTIEFAEGSVLSGAADTAAPDTFTGIGLRLDGHKNITIKNARIRGYKVGIRATACPGLTVDGADLSDNYRQHLKSTPQAEDGADWLYPHHNDDEEWTTNYGAALSIKNAEHITLRNIRVRQGQNGIILDRVSDSAIYDNDCSFLSGWGIAMWRSNRNTITRNALDFCIRGYSHMVYNRGQDSAGLLMFEQNCGNIIAENSISHGGDGIFGFAGREAIGEAPAPATPDGKPFDYARRGNSDNLFIANDLSYAAAHGLEMTFSAGNQVLKNRFVQNAICGIWGGYSNDTLIAENTFEGNGDMAYGLERGGINIEHGSGNLIVSNAFKGNKCGVHLWWNVNPGLAKLAGAAANERGASGNIIVGNTFDGDALALQLRDDPEASGAPHVRGTVFGNNTLKGVAKERDVAAGIEVAESGSSPDHVMRPFSIMGESHPVGARKDLWGRQNIVMTEWGPWDHSGPLARVVRSGAGEVEFEFSNIQQGHARGGLVSTNATLEGDEIRSTRVQGTTWYGVIRCRPGEVRRYKVSVSEGGYHQSLLGAVSDLSWDMRVFPWSGPAGPNPPPDLAAWRAAADGPRAVSAETHQLTYAFGMRGPSEMEISPEITAAKFAPDHFGIIARASLSLSPGKWRVTTTSDDGIRVIADGKAILENWTHHGAATDTAEFEAGARPVDLTVEYFEIFGAAVLDVQFEPVNPQ